MLCFTPLEVYGYMEINELIAAAVTHEAGSNKDCPFCPVEKGKKLKTYKGEDNNSETLEDIMVNPDVLNDHQANAWPHSGDTHPSREDVEAKHKHPDYGYYEFQAHHLISGNQALKNHKVEQWIDASKKKIEEDSGYTVNGSKNGIWAPSWPKKFRKGEFEGEWTKEETDRQSIANYVMEKEGCQFHLGGHNIKDINDQGETRHKKYDNWLKNWLTKINQRMWAWSRKCPICSHDGKRKDPPFQPNHRINMVLNRLSSEAKRQITAQRKEWTIFLSKLALNYHNDVCDHPEPGKKVREK